MIQEKCEIERLSENIKDEIGIKTTYDKLIERFNDLEEKLEVILEMIERLSENIKLKSEPTEDEILKEAAETVQAQDRKIALKNRGVIQDERRDPQDEKESRETRMELIQRIRDEGRPYFENGGVEEMEEKNT